MSIDPLKKKIKDLGSDAGKRFIYGSKNIGSHRGEFVGLDAHDNASKEAQRKAKLENGNIYMRYYTFDNDGIEHIVDGPVDDGHGNYMLPNEKGFYIKTDQANLDIEYQIEMQTEKRIDELMKYASLSSSLACKTLGIPSKEFVKLCARDNKQYSDIGLIVDCSPEKIKLYAPYSESQNMAILKLRKIVESNMTTLVKNSGTSKKVINEDLQPAPLQ